MHSLLNQDWMVGIPPWESPWPYALGRERYGAILVIVHQLPDLHFVPASHYLFVPDALNIDCTIATQHCACPHKEHIMVGL